MGKITASEVNTLRKMSGAGIMDCKNALVESNGDFDVAIEILRKKGQKVAAKRADRKSSEGAVIAKVDSKCLNGIIISLNCETAKTLKEDVLKGYKIGADDYLTKPFDSDILLLKIKSIFKRKKLINSREIVKHEFKFAKFKFNSKLRTLQFESEPIIKLSPKENQLLRMLLNYLNDLMPRELALVKIWNDDNYFTSRSMDVYIAKIRKYLSKDPSVEIENIHGEGFRLIINK